MAYKHLPVESRTWAYLTTFIAFVHKLRKPCRFPGSSLAIGYNSNLSVPSSQVLIWFYIKDVYHDRWWHSLLPAHWQLRVQARLQARCRRGTNGEQRWLLCRESHKLRAWYTYSRFKFLCILYVLFTHLKYSTFIMHQFTICRSFTYLIN